MQLADRSRTLIADYSHGMSKKLALAAAVIHGPRILFLDEPFEGVGRVIQGLCANNLASFAASPECNPEARIRLWGLEAFMSRGWVVD
jgi:ABC-2 type transport system ATP-binding protein